jgi:hypothetical protein
MKFLSDQNIQIEIQLLNRNFKPMLLGSPEQAGSTPVEVLGMMGVLFQLGLMARTAKTTTKQNVG